MYYGGSFATGFSEPVRCHSMYVMIDTSLVSVSHEVSVMTYMD